MVRVNREATKAVAIFHVFGGALPERVDIELPTNSRFRIVSTFAEDKGGIEIKQGMLSFRVAGNFTAISVLL